MESYYGMRRKRNLDLSRILPQNPPSIDDPEEDVLEEGYEYEEIDDDSSIQNDDYNDEVNNPGPVETRVFLLDGKPFIPKQMPKKQSFNETHVRITTYLERNVHQIIKMLQKQGQIESITKFINDGMKDYLMNHYHKNNQY